jgi:hypothetical protein
MLVQDELYGRSDPFWILHDFICPETYDFPAFALQLGRAARIGLLLESVMLAVDLDHEPS